MRRDAIGQELFVDDYVVVIQVYQTSLYFYTGKVVKITSDYIQVAQCMTYPGNYDPNRFQVRKNPRCIRIDPNSVQPTVKDYLNKEFNQWLTTHKKFYVKL